MSAPLDSSPNPLDGFAVAHRDDCQAPVIFIRGELDLASAAQLDDELRFVEALAPERIVIDCRELEFIDSTGLSVLVHAQRRAERDGRQLVLTQVPRQAQRLFSVTGLAPRFTFA